MKYLAFAIALTGLILGAALYARADEGGGADAVQVCDGSHCVPLPAGNGGDYTMPPPPADDGADAVQVCVGRYCAQTLADGGD